MAFIASNRSSEPIASIQPPLLAAGKYIAFIEADWVAGLDPSLHTYNIVAYSSKKVEMK